LILVVDDEVLLRTLLVRGLNEGGFRAIVARNGQEALNLFAARQQEIALVLLDVRMPGMDGLETLERLKRIDPDVRCCFMSGDLGGRSVGQLEATGALHLFAKPFLLDDLLTTLRRLTGKEESHHESHE
jgi:DNA-binding NtrC family response regulator